MKVTALFAGIGGLEEGLRRAGHETLMTCETWAPAVAVLAAHHPSVPNHPDVTTLNDIPLETELLTAGFPCQDLSQAGGMRGISGAKSGLVENVFRLLDKVPVPLVLLENVPFMLQLDKGAAMLHLTNALEERGYRWAYRIVSSESFVPQRRERVFFLASRCALDPADVLMVDDAARRCTVTPLHTHAHGFYWTEGTRGLGWADDAVPTLKNGSTIGIPSPPAILLPDGQIIKPDIRDAERLQGFPADWTLPAVGAGRASLRWSLVGNAVTVAVAEWLGSRLKCPGSYGGERDRPWPSKAHAWPRAARLQGGAKIRVDISPHPLRADRLPLHDFLQHAGTPLSLKATTGFLRRAEASSLRFSEGFLDRVRDHVAVMASRGNDFDPMTIQAAS